MEEIRTIAVVGAGQMGSGIAQVAAMSGYEVIIQDIAEAQLDRGRGGIDKSLTRMAAKQKITEEQQRAALGRIRTTTALSDLAAADLVIEAATENEELKKTLFRSLDQVCRPEVILASNTSSISITRLAAATSRPDRVVGMHFMNPVPVMKLVELIRGLPTSDDTFDAVDAVSKKMGKTTVVAQDYPGFIVNRVLMPMINEAVVALHEGVASAADIDQAMKLGTNQPMGPLELADFIGLDTCLAIMEVLHTGLGDAKYRPCPLLRRYVDAGYTGRKAGRGFFDYSAK